MNLRQQQIINAWTAAAVDLDIKVTPNFKLVTDQGNRIEFLLLIEGFGSKKGTLILSLDNLEEFNTPEKHGYYCSALSTESYSIYNREDFIDTLEDWQYFGEPTLKPIWYKGIYEE